jgi:hypothetical protein
MVTSFTVGWTGWFTATGPIGSALAGLGPGQEVLVAVPRGALGPCGAPVVAFADSTMVTDGYFMRGTPNEAVVLNAISYVLRIPCPCYSNCDRSTIPPVLNVNDFLCFINGFAAGNLVANCDGSTLAPVLNVIDFTCFLNRYAAGCP